MCISLSCFRLRVSECWCVCVYVYVCVNLCLCVCVSVYASHVSFFNVLCAIVFALWYQCACESVGAYLCLSVAVTVCVCAFCELRFVSMPKKYLCVSVCVPAPWLCLACWLHKYSHPGPSQTYKHTCCTYVCVCACIVCLPKSKCSSFLFSKLN